MTRTSSFDASMPVVVQRWDRFVGRTMNWLYDHLRFVPRYSPQVVCDYLENRDDFPELTAWPCDRNRFVRKVWRRISGNDVDPFVARRLRGMSPRALHSHFGYVALDDYGWWRSLNVPWVIGFYGADVYQLGRREEWRKRYARLFADCSRVLPLGPAMARRLQELGCPAEKITVHPLGVATAELRGVPRTRRPSEPLKLLFAGTFREKKGVQFALRAVAEVHRTGIPVQLQLVAEASDKPGDRETEQAASRLIADLGLNDVVIRRSFLSFQGLLDLALNSHVFLAPSVTAVDGDAEGTPFVLQQMMATAMPVIATDHSDIPFLFGGLSHLLVPERNAEAIAARLIEYARQPRLLVEHGRLFREQIVSSFDVRACASKLGDIYDSL
jgi:colanic acid/amylovoran biosynthesis glycosyltransferase